MTFASDSLHTMVREARRVRGVLQLRTLSSTGKAPTAVLAAIRNATLNRNDAVGKAAIHRIELLRSLLLTSEEHFQLGDLGAGATGEFDDGNLQTLSAVKTTIGKMTGYSKPPRWAALLFYLIRELKPTNCVEMGSCVGISAAYQGVALELNGAGHLITLEGSNFLAERSARTIHELELGRRVTVRPGNFADTLDPAIADLTPLDWAFVDGNHKESATLDYLERLLPALGDEAVLVFDDINWSDGMKAAWAQIKRDERFAMTVDLRAMGLAVISRSATQRQELTVSYY